jgi:hypothetical protein
MLGASSFERKMSALAPTGTANRDPSNETNAMVFQRFETGSRSSFHPFVHNPDTDIRIEVTGRDMPKDRRLIKIYSGKHPVFSFEVSWKYFNEEKMVVYSASLDRIKNLVEKYGKKFSPAISENLLISEINEGVRLLFQEESRVA